MSVRKVPFIQSRWPFGNFSSALSVVRKHRHGMSASESERLSPSGTEDRVPEPAQAEAKAANLKTIMGDVLLVALWGAMIPGLMWLGDAAGF